MLVREREREREEKERDMRVRSDVTQSYIIRYFKYSHN